MALAKCTPDEWMRAVGYEIMSVAYIASDLPCLCYLNVWTLLCLTSELSCSSQISCFDRHMSSDVRHPGDQEETHKCTLSDNEDSPVGGKFYSHSKLESM